jgi:hypothetical protein
MESDLHRPASLGSFAGRSLDDALDSMADHQRGHLTELISSLSVPV